MTKISSPFYWTCDLLLFCKKRRIKGNRIAIKKKLTEKEKKCAMAEELGHYCTECGNILDQSSVASKKQEFYGRAHAYDR